jgi:hypothetical protein
MGIGRPRRSLLLNSIQLAVLFVAGWVGGLVAGAVGVALAVVAAYVVGMLLTPHLLPHTVAVDFRGLLGKSILVAAIVILGSVALNRILPLNTWPVAVRAAEKMIYAMVAFVAVSWLIQPKETNARVAYIMRLARAR